MASSVQFMACRLLCTKPSQPMMACCQLDTKGHISLKIYLKIKSFHSITCIWEGCLQNGDNIVSTSIYEYLQYTKIVMTSSNGNIFRVTGPLCGEFTGHRWIPLTKTSDAKLWCFLWSAPEQRLSKQSRRRWFETPSHSLWRNCNDLGSSRQSSWMMSCD